MVWGVDEGGTGERGLYVLVVGGSTVDAWALLVIAVMGWVGLVMVVVGKEHEGYSHDRFAR